MARRSAFKSMDDLNAKTSAGLADGVHTSTWLTESGKHTHRKHAMDISPQDASNVLDPTDLHPNGQPKLVIDLMFP